MSQKRDILLKYWDYGKNADIDPQIIPISSKERVYLKCPVCNLEWQSVVSSFTKRCLEYGCAKCAGVRVYTIAKGTSVLSKYPEIVPWLDYSKQSLEQVRGINVGGKESIHMKCLYCKKKFSLTALNIDLNNNWHFSAKCVKSLHNKVLNLSNKLENSQRFRILYAVHGPYKHKFIEYMKSMLNGNQYDVFEKMFIKLFTVQEIANSKDISKQRVGQLVAIIKQKADIVLTKFPFSEYEFGKDLSKLEQEYIMLEQFYETLASIRASKPN